MKTEIGQFAGKLTRARADAGKLRAKKAVVRDRDEVAQVDVTMALEGLVTSLQKTDEYKKLEWAMNNYSKATRGKDAVQAQVLLDAQIALEVRMQQEGVPKEDVSGMLDTLKGVAELAIGGAQRGGFGIG